MATQNYVLLERIELNNTATSVTFSNIPQTGYTDLKLVASARTTTAGTAIQDSLFVNFNGSTASQTSRWINTVNGTSASSGSDTRTYLGFGANSSVGTANTFGNAELYIPNYAGSANKSFSSDGVAENNGTAAALGMTANLWANTAAITSISLVPSGGGSFVANSTFSLYGIANSNTTPVVAPKATGGNVIATDGTYWYHAFLSNGTFTPAVGLSCDVLQVAGGGGGGGGSVGTTEGGGGGAGGVLAFASQALIASNYGVTVGAGGPGGLTTAGTSGVNSQFGSLTASVGGGGGGGRGISSGVGLSGGSGGGGTYLSAAGGTATSGQGYAGGTGSGSQGAAGGGGGAGAVGGPGGQTLGGSGGGTGGAGVNTYTGWGTFAAAFSATGLGVSGYLAGGGGGGGNTSGIGNGASGGAGGGGQAAQYNANTAVAGKVNSGSGGGGGVGTTYSTGGAGGSGISNSSLLGSVKGDIDMSHWAEVDSNNTVLRVLVGNNSDPNEGYDWLIENLGGRWVKTSYNGNIRKNFAGIGYTYDEGRDAFIAPKPECHPDLVTLDEETCTWSCSDATHVIIQGE